MTEKTQFLRQIPVFEGLSDKEIESVADRFTERRYQKNEIVFFEEDTGHYMYVIRQGRVKVTRTLPTGRETILAFHEPGEYFGEMSLIDGKTAPATVTALEPTVILSMGQREFDSLLKNPEVSRSLLTTLCRRCRDAWAHISMLTFNHADARIRAALYLLCQNKGETTERGIRIKIHLTHRELAEITGISRETVTRVLGQLQSEGLVLPEQKTFIITDAQKLVDPLLPD